MLNPKDETLMRWTRLFSLVAVLVGCCVGGPATAEKVEMGVLTCTMAEGGDAPAGNATAAASERDAVCSLQLNTGSEETYSGRVQGVSLSADGGAAVLWKVTAAAATPMAPGLLQQAYEADPTAPKDQAPTLIGEVNSEIILQSMADPKEGNTSQSEKQPPKGFVVLRLELKLKATAG